MKCSDTQKEYLKAGLLGVGAGALGWGIEAARQNYLVRVDDNKADSFIKNTVDKNLKKKYRYIRDNFNSKNTEIVKEARDIGKALQIKVAFAFFALFEASYMTSKLVGHYLNKRTPKDVEESSENE